MTSAKLRPAHKWWTTTLAIGATALLSIAGTATANAADDDVEYADNGAPIVVAQGDVDPVLVAEVEAAVAPLLAATSGTQFDAAAAIAAGASEQDVADFAAVIAAEGGTVIGATGAAPSAVAVQTAAAVAACAGYNGYRGFYPSGYQWALNSCNTSKLISAVGLGAAGAGAVAAILSLAGAPQAGVIAAAAAAIIGLGATFLVVCQSWASNNALYLNSGIPGAIPPSCWGQ